MTELKTKLQEQDGFIRQILAISNVPAFSIGVMHKGQVVHTAHYGTREEGRDLTPDDNTVYRVASLTKTITACAVACLVDDGKLDWDTPVKKYLPDFAERKDDIGSQATLRDLLSNRTGLAASDYYWGQQYGEFLLPKDELVRITTAVPAVKPFRKGFVYAGWNYGLVTEAVEAVAGMTLGQYIDKRLLKPLGIDRTTYADTQGWENLALAYGLASDGSRRHINFQQMNDGLGIAGAYGVKSCISTLR